MKNSRLRIRYMLIYFICFMVSELHFLIQIIQDESHRKSGERCMEVELVIWIYFNSCWISKNGPMIPNLVYNMCERFKPLD